MKKTVQIILSVILLLNALTGISSAAGTNVALTDLDMTFTAPDGWTVLTRDVSEDEQYLSILELSKDDLLKHFEENNIYADLVTESGQKEIVIAKFSDSGTKTIYNLSDLNDQALEKQKDKLLGDGSTSSEQMSYSSNTVYRKNNLTYIACDAQVKTEAGSYPAIQYYTVYNGMGVSILYAAYDGTVTDQDKITAGALVDSLTVTLKERAEVGLIRSFLTNFSWLFFSLAGLAVLAAVLLIFVIKKKKTNKAE